MRVNRHEYFEEVGDGGDVTPKGVSISIFSLYIR